MKLLVNATEHLWWKVHISSGSGLVPWSGNKPLHEPWLTQNYGTTKPKWVSTLRPEQNGQHFADNIFECIFLNKNFGVLIWISLKLVAKCLIYNKSASVQVMTGCQAGAKPLLDAMYTKLHDVTGPQWVTGIQYAHDSPFIVFRCGVR